MSNQFRRIFQKYLIGGKPRQQVKSTGDQAIEIRDIVSESTTESLCWSWTIKMVVEVGLVRELFQNHYNWNVH